MAPAALAPAGLRPLGQAELRNELALFGEPLAEMALPAHFSRIYDVGESGSLDNRELDSAFLQRHGTFVSGLAARVTANAERLGELLSCELSGDIAICEAHLHELVMDRLFRGLATGEVAESLATAFAEGERVGGFSEGASVMLSKALQHPAFLYHVERGRPVGDGNEARVQLTDLELASRLSFVLWGRGPDAELLTLARDGRLSEPSDIANAARRLLGDPRAEVGVARFYRELLGIDEGRRFDAEAGVSPEVLALMDREFSSFVWHATVDPGKGDAAALVEPRSWANEALARYYEWTGIEGSAFQSIELDPTRYAGLLTLPAWLTRASGPTWTHPSVRGWWVARGLLCESVPAEPEGVIQNGGPPNLTARERLALHTSNPICIACHRVSDPPGLALEHFDSLGRYREDDDGLPIDTSDLPTSDGSGAFDGVQGLGEQVVAAADERSCLARQWVQFALGAGAMAGPASDCTTELQQLVSRDLSVPALLVALTQTEAFRFRRPSP